MELFVSCAEKAERINDFRNLAQALAHIANLFAEAGQHQQADEYLQDAITIAEESRSPLVVVQVQHQQGKILRHVGKIDQLLPLLRRSVRLLEQSGESDSLANARARLGEALIQHGDWQEAATVLRTVIDAPVDTARPRTRASAYRFLAALYSRRELWDEATEAADQAVSFAQASGSRSEQMHCHHTRGNVLARRSHWDEAATEYEQAAVLATALHDFPTMLIIRSNQAAGAMAKGNTESAITIVREQLSRADLLGMEDLQVALRLNLGNALSQQKDHIAAKEEYEHALALARRLGTTDLVAQASHLLGRAQLSLDDPRAALFSFHQARMAWQERGNLAAASQEFELELATRMIVAEQDGENTTRVPVPNDVPKRLLNTLHARRMAEDTARGADSEDHFPDRRTVAVAQEIIDELATVRLDEVFARLATGRRHCLECRLPIAEGGSANAVLIRFRDAPPGITLAHPTCAPSAIIGGDHDSRSDEVVFETECIIFSNDLPGIVVDTRGPWGTDDKGQTRDLFLDALRAVGFGTVGEVSAQSEDPQGLQLATAHLEAKLLGNELTITQGDKEIIPRMPLSFLPNWYATTQNRTLLALFGHDLRGMAADDPSYLIKSAQAGTLVGAAIKLTVVPPPRNRACVCTPKSGRKFKHCCGRPPANA